MKRAKKSESESIPDGESVEESTESQPQEKEAQPSTPPKQLTRSEQAAERQRIFKANVEAKKKK